MKLVKISIKRSTFPIVLFTILVLMGTFFYGQLRYELLPKISAPVVTISTVYPGASPAETEQSVTIPIEDAMASMENIDEIMSTSMEGVSIVQVNLKMEADIDIAMQDAQRKIDFIRKDLPEDILNPQIKKFDISALPIIKMGAFAEIGDKELFQLMDDRIQPALSQIAGVAQVDILGGSEREIKINLDAEKMKAFGISPVQVQRMISASNLEFPTGKIKDDKTQVIVRLSGKMQSLKQMEDLIIKQSKEGNTIRLKDIAEVQDGTKEVEIITRINSRNAIGVTIQKQSDANAVDVSELILEQLTLLEQEYSDVKLQFEISDDQSEFTLEAANAVMKDLIFAIILVSLVMLFFLQSLRNSMFVLISIPTSLVATFTIMYLFDFTLDLISLMSLSLVVGSLVDDAIVVIENIYRHMELGKKRIQASYDAVKELGLTVTAITLVLVAVFLPLAFVSGPVGQLIREYAIIIVFSMLLSLLVSFTLVPLMTSRFAKLEIIKEKSLLGRIIAAFEGLINKVNRITLSSMQWALRHKFITLLTVVILFIGSIALIPAGFIGTAFIDSGDRGNFLLQFEMPKDVTIEETNFAVFEAEKLLMQYPDVESIFTTVGRRSGKMSTQGTPYYAEINVKLIPHDQRDVKAAVLARKVRADLEARVSGPKIKSANVNIMGNEDAPIKFYITGSNLNDIITYAHSVENILADIPGTAEIESSVEAGNPEINISVDRDKMARLGLTIADVGITMQTAFAGNTDNQYRQGENEFDINIRFDENNRMRVSDIEDFSFINGRGESIKLNQFASFEHATGPSKLERYNRTKSTTITSQIIGVSQGTVQKAFNEKVAKTPHPENTQVVYSKMTQMMEDAFADLGLALIAAIIFIYLIMVVLYNNW
ncbi:MAG: efflux RND transporter permease subunit, partial [Bacteroidales bacterium]|nr:efflux RND transporter permease subunit [Bacteroidales bacterium]